MPMSGWPAFSILSIDFNQLVLDPVGFVESASQRQNAVFANSLIFPLYFAAASTLILLLHIVINFKSVRKLFNRPDATTEEPVLRSQPESLVQEFKLHVKKHGGHVIYGYMFIRLIGVLALLALSVTTLVLDELNDVRRQEVDTTGKWGKKHGKKKYGTKFTKREWLEAAMCLTYLYTALLAIVSVAAKPRWSRVVIRHLNTVLLAAFCVYIYRDIYPLITFSLKPKDLSEGAILWAKVAVLTFTSVIIPLSIPRQYIPVDPKNPLPEPNPEQTASIFSMLTYAFLDPLVFTAFRVPHLKFEQLPPLNDNDYAENLKALSFKHLDLFSGAPRRHLFFGLMRIFRKDYMQLAAMVLLHVCANFAGPIGINRLLRYLEPGGETAVIRPWFWILWLFIGPVSGTLSIQWYIFIATRTLVRAQAIITQLVFEHSLRIRVKAETAESTAVSRVASPETLTPDSASVREGTIDGSEMQHSATLTEAESTTVHSSTASDSSSKGPIKTQKDKKDKDSKKMEEPTSTASNLVGKINNLVTTDLENITDGRDFLFVVLYIPVQIILCIIFLYIILGWSAFIGLGVIIVTFPLPGVVAKLVQKVQERRLKKTDARVQSVTESMNVLRMIKLFGWESKMEHKIADTRDEELIWIRRRQFLELSNNVLTFVIPLLTMITTYVTYVRITLVMGESLSASIVFSSITVFDMLREQMTIIFRSINDTMTAKVSLDRVTDFLRNTELLDSFDKGAEADYFVPADQNSDEIGFRNATFTWSSDVDGSLTPSKRKFLLKIEDELLFKKNRINLVIGETGSGKSSLLMALLSEMHFVPSGPDSWYNLPRNQGVAYAAQESWVQNETIKENIVFGAPYDEARYKAVIYACGLERDLSLFEAGNETEVGEKGLTISGGQKARITLARAIYSKASIILLDDVLAALDVHTSKWIVDKCLSGDLVQGRTVILVTHNVAMARPIASFVVALKEGRVESQGTISDALGKDAALQEEAKKEQQIIDKATEEVDEQPPPDENKADGKLIVAEEIQEGHVSWPAVKMYLTSMGGQYSFTFFLAFVIALGITETLSALQTWYLGFWASQYDHHQDVNVVHYISLYALLMAATVVVFVAGALIYVFGTVRASRAIHSKLIASIFGTTLRWLDTTPTSRVIARCTQDIRAVDGPVAMWLQYVTELSMVMLVKFAAVVVLTPLFFFPGVLVAVLGAACGQIYIKAQLSVKREMSNAKAPVLGHFGAAIAGLASIRAYGVEETFRLESLKRINKFTRTARTFFNLNRWVCIRIDMIGGLFAAALATYLIYFSDQEGSSVGFSLNMAVGFSSLILWWIRCLNEFEVSGNSLERIQGYLTIEQESKPTSKGAPPAYWPASGELNVENLSARYAPDGPWVLHDLSFKIHSGERVGVIGRCLDGVAINSINLDALRSSITIIPQMPELLSGSLRQNLDPFDQYDDATLNDALRAAGLFALQSEMDEGRITLDSAISSGGGNMSVGQRQILALARAIVRGSKLLILDEATSAIDYKTDSVIQDSLRNELKGDVTLILVAHRLHTVMDADKIMVLDAGRIVEFDSPRALLQIKDGKLRALVDESNDKDVLYAMAEKQSSS